MATSSVPLLRPSPAPRSERNPRRSVPVQGLDVAQVRPTACRAPASPNYSLVHTVAGLDGCLGQPPHTDTRATKSARTPKMQAHSSADPRSLFLAPCAAKNQLVVPVGGPGQGRPAYAALRHTYTPAPPQRRPRARPASDSPRTRRT